MKLVVLCLFVSSLLVGYVYTLLSAHIILARVDKKINIPRRKCGEIKIIDLKKFAAKFDVYEFEVKRAICLLTLNNYVIYLLLGLLVLFMVDIKTVG